MTPPLCLPTYFPPIPLPYPPLTSLHSCSSTLFLIWHLPSPLAPRPFPLFRHLCPSLLFSFFFILFYFLLFHFIFFHFLLLFYYFPFPSHLAPSLDSLLPLLFFIPSDSYYFSFSLLILLRSPFPTPFFPHSLRHCLQFLPSLFELSFFFSSSFSPSLFRCPSPFPHHSLLHVSSSLFIPPYPPLIHPLLIFLFFILFSFHLFLFFLFLSPSSTFSVPFSLFFLSFSSSSFFLPFHSLFLYFLPFLPPLSLVPSPSSLRPYFILLHLSSSFSHHSLLHISSIFFSYLFLSRLPLLSLLPLLMPSFFFQPPFFFLSLLFLLLPSCSSFLSFFINFSFISLLIVFASLIPPPFPFPSPMYPLYFSSVSFLSPSSTSPLLLPFLPLSHLLSLSYFLSPPPPTFRPSVLRRSRVLENGNLERIFPIIHCSPLFTIF